MFKYKINDNVERTYDNVGIYRPRSYSSLKHFTLIGSSLLCFKMPNIYLIYMHVHTCMRAYAIKPARDSNAN